VRSAVTEKLAVEAPHPAALHAWTVYVYVPSARPDTVAESVDALVVTTFALFS
jgi:hypothetical protein